MRKRWRKREQENKRHQKENKNCTVEEETKKRKQ